MAYSRCGLTNDLYSIINVFIAGLGNTLPDYVAEANFVNTFKNRLDKYWTNQDVVYDYKSDLIRTGGLPVCA